MINEKIANEKPYLNIVNGKGEILAKKVLLIDGSELTPNSLDTTYIDICLFYSNKNIIEESEVQIMHWYNGKTNFQVALTPQEFKSYVNTLNECLYKLYEIVPELKK